MKTKESGWESVRAACGGGESNDEQEEEEEEEENVVEAGGLLELSDATEVEGEDAEACITLTDRSRSSAFIDLSDIPWGEASCY